jgi:hypothetical protein
MLNREWDGYEIENYGISRFRSLLDLVITRIHIHQVLY